jgi:GntR family transcriptional regulator
MREWKPHAAIPNEGDLAREFGVSPGTMRKALDLLEGQHLVTRRQGRGTFVNDQGADQLAVRFSNIRGPDGERISGQVESAEITAAAANELECARLRLRAHDAVYRVHRVRLHRDQAFMVEDASMPAALFPGLADKSGFSHRIADLAQKHGLLLGKAEERLTIDAAAPEVAAVLGIAPAAPIVVLDRIVETLDGHPIEWRIGQCHLAGAHYVVEMR